MPKLPILSGAEVVRKLTRAGWVVDRQKGSHVMMTKPATTATLSVPGHGEIDRGSCER